MNALRPSHIETSEPKLKIIDEKFQYKDKFIFNNTLLDVIWIKIIDMIK